MHTSIRAESRERLDADVPVMKKAQSHMMLRKDKLTMLFGKRVSLTAEEARLQTQNAKKTSKATELKSAANKKDWLARRANAVRRAKNSFGGPSTAAYPALFEERDKFKTRYEASMLKNQCIQSLADKAIQ